MKKILILLIIPFTVFSQKTEKLDLMKVLGGTTWVNNKYKNVLYASNSVFDAENSISYKESLIFKFSSYYDANNNIVVSSYNPNWMEERQYTLRNDSVVIHNYDKKTYFKISQITNNTLTLKFSNNKKETFIKTKTNNVYEGLDNINREWFAGSYKLQKNKIQGNITFKKDGSIFNESNILNNYNSYKIYGCKTCENDKISILVLYGKNDINDRLYLIIERQKKKNNIIVLSKTKPLEDIDFPLERNGEKIFLKRNSNSLKQKFKYVTAKSGLTVREKPNLKSKKIAKLNYSQEVKIHKTTGYKLSITDEGKRIHGEWVKVSSYQQKKIIGYVFDGFLSNEKINPPITIKSFSEYSDEIVGCSCYYSLNKNDFQADKYIYIDNYEDIAFVYINGNKVKFKPAKNQSEYKYGMKLQWINDDYKIFFNLKEVGQIDETWQKEGKMILKSKDGFILELNIYGECGS